MKRSGQLRIGISGWPYAGWREKFYPKGLPQHRGRLTAGAVSRHLQYFSSQMPL